MKICNTIFLILMCIGTSRAQNVGIGTTTPSSSAVLDIVSTNKGLLIPRMTSAQRNAIPGPVNGLLVYDTSTSGFWFYNGVAWTNLGAGGGASEWKLTGNSGTTSSHFIGTTDNAPLRLKVNNQPIGLLGSSRSIYLGLQAGLISTGSGNIGIGNSALCQNAGRSQLIGIGDSTLYNNGIGAANGEGVRNIAIGSKALYANTKGFNNTGIGFQSLTANTTGFHNTAVGNNAMHSNTQGGFNTSTGAGSLYYNTTGHSNSSLGYNSLYYNTTGTSNTALGSSALFYNTSGSGNCAIGNSAAFWSSTGHGNVAVGNKALFRSTEAC